MKNPGKSRCHGKTLVNDESDLILATVVRSIDPNEIVFRWNRYEDLRRSLEEMFNVFEEYSADFEKGSVGRDVVESTRKLLSELKA